MTLKELVNHLAEIPGYIAMVMGQESMNYGDYKAPDLNSKVDLLYLLQENAEKAEAALRKPDEEYQKIWKMVYGEKTLMEMPRLNALRSMALSQLPHHRAQLGVYYRLLDIPVPASYGPSADER
ncbi:DinB family protein [Antarcticibacterium sp. 1MA-6-2]|uniref:DinB family protein n=1 Tax=Antarcticibacterium sp. 1MA-6-2 TaxID=2908210 RepID=UPI001F385BB0|nr:DinB family protein [Antarcticibacterium sp. 1MA-6-2]UJH92444.1 DinB family protein [Antarcticibacterium sp. 1MA-6-2]